MLQSTQVDCDSHLNPNSLNRVHKRVIKLSAFISHSPLIISTMELFHLLLISLFNGICTANNELQCTALPTYMYNTCTQYRLSSSHFIWLWIQDTPLQQSQLCWNFPDSTSSCRGYQPKPWTWHLPPVKGPHVVHALLITNLGSPETNFWALTQSSIAYSFNMVAHQITRNKPTAANQERIQGRCSQGQTINTHANSATIPAMQLRLMEFSLHESENSYSLWYYDPSTFVQSQKHGLPETKKTTTP